MRLPDGGEEACVGVFGVGDAMGGSTLVPVAGCEFFVGEWLLKRTCYGDEYVGSKVEGFGYDELSRGVAESGGAKEEKKGLRIIVGSAESSGLCIAEYGEGRSRGRDAVGRGD